MTRRLRYWIIQRLAGRDLVLLNAEVADDAPGGVVLRQSGAALIAGNTIRTGIRIVRA